MDQKTALSEGSSELLLRPIDLGAEITKSEMSALYPRIQTESKGALSIHDLIRTTGFENPQPGILIGLSRFHDLESNELREVFKGVADEIGASTWMDIYRDLKLDLKDPLHTQKFMSSVLSSSRPVFFMVPPELFSFHENGLLQKEIQYLFDGAPTEHRLQNVHFVFGFYEAFSHPEFLKRLAPIKNPLERRQFIRKWIGNFWIDRPDLQNTIVVPETLKRRVQ